MRLSKKITLESRPAFWGRATLFLAAVLIAGCAPQSSQNASPGKDPAPTTSETLAPGVLHRALPTGPDAGVDLIDVDLSHSSLRPAVVAWNIQRKEGTVAGQAYTPSEWLGKAHALAAINGGYFGMDFPDGSKEVAGLFVQGSHVRRAQSVLHGRGSASVPGGSYVRSAFGVTQDGMPQIVWAATSQENPMSLSAYTTPTPAHPNSNGTPWHVQSAVGCGPRLIADGKVDVTDGQERLVSAGSRARTFVAYDGERGQPHHFVMGIASDMTYQDLAAFLSHYFSHYDQTQARDAMCLDGGSSTQLSYRTSKGIQSPRDTETSVPDAVVLREPSR